MNTFKEQSLEIKSENKLNECTIIWLGRSDLAEPVKSLAPFFQLILGQIPNRQLLMDFTKLEFMNSSTVPAIISFAKLLNEKGISSKIIYDNNQQWQRNSFRALQTVCMRLTNIKIEAT